MKRWNALALFLCWLPIITLADDCTRAANKLADHPTPNDVDSLLGYMLEACHASFFHTLRQIFDRETREPYWAKPLEAKIEAAAQGTEELELKGGCHRSLCRYVAHFAHPDLKVPVRQNFNQRLFASVAGTPLEVASVYDAIDPSANDGLVIYYYSRREDAEFVQPLAQAFTRTTTPPPQ